MLIFKVLRAAEWAEFDHAGRTAGAPLDRSDGFVHFSTGEQLPETLRRHFAGEACLWLVVCETDDLGPALRWEPSRGGADFPHLYRQLERGDVLWARPLVDEMDVTE